MLIKCKLFLTTNSAAFDGAPAGCGSDWRSNGRLLRSPGAGALVYIDAKRPAQTAAAEQLYR